MKATPRRRRCCCCTSAAATERQGIHGTHVGPGVHIRYAPSDEKRQTIPWVEYRDAKGKARHIPPATPKARCPAICPFERWTAWIATTGPAHTYEMPERAVDRPWPREHISPSLPFAKKTSVDYPEGSLRHPGRRGGRASRRRSQKFYREKYPAIYASRDSRKWSHSARGVLAIYKRNMFPAMKVTWGAYPNNVGHTDFPGCFRCHDDGHVPPVAQDHAGLRRLPQPAGHGRSRA